MDITSCCASSFVMLCQAFTAATFSCSLFVGLSAFSFVFTNCKVFSVELKSGVTDLPIEDYHISPHHQTLVLLLQSFLNYLAECGKHCTICQESQHQWTLVAQFYYTLCMTKECNQWFACCCKPSLFPFMKVSLDCRPWPWYTYFLYISSLGLF